MMRVRRLSLMMAMGAPLLLAGCGGFVNPAPATVDLGGLQGSVFGGQQAIAGAGIQIYAAGTSGYGSSARPLITTRTVLTQSDGSFNLAATFTCQPGDLVYIVATQGNPGVYGTQNNSALALMTGLGDCAAINTSTKIRLNELTTVSTVWALAPFMVDISHVGTSAANLQGLRNAFATINKLVNTATGNSPGAALPAGATLPLGEMNTLADILAACVNSIDTTSPAAQSGSCQALMAGATLGTNVPSTTVQAAINLAHIPTLGLATLPGLVTAQSPFQPTLSGAAATPSSWTLAIHYVGGGLKAPKGIAADATGALWITNPGNSSVTKLDNTGAALSGPTGFTVGSLNLPVAIAIDTAGNAWVANSGNSTVSRISADGSAGSFFSGGGLNGPTSIAIDADGDVWVTNQGNSTVTQLSNSGVLLSGTGYGGGGISQPVGIAIDPY